MTLSVPLVVDASVLVAAMRPGETHHRAAREMLELLGRRKWSFSAPMIGLAEVAAAISRATGSSVRAQREVDLVRRLPSFTLVAIDASLGETAATIAANQRIRGCDAVYVALAHQLGAALVTLDQEQGERSAQILAVFAPDEILERLAQ